LKKEFWYFDSKGGQNEAAIEAVRAYLIWEYQRQQLGELDLSSWTENCPGDTIPQQENGHDCGVFALRFAALYVFGANFHFAQPDMPAWRDRTMLDWLQGNLSA